MNKLYKSLTAFIFLIASTNLLAVNNHINLTVKGYHSNNERLLENNSILFSGDSFQIEVESKSAIYIYAFLLDSNLNLQQLGGSNSELMVNQGEFINFPNNTNNWYQLDDSVGNETLFFLTSELKIDTSNISSVDELKSKGIVHEFVIRHLSSKVAMRGISDLRDPSDEDLKNSIFVSTKISEDLNKQIGKNSQNTRALEILREPSNLPMTNSATRGVKEVQIFEDASPAVVLIETEYATGSGALISSDGLIFTNSHVVGDAKKVTIYFKPTQAGKYSNNEIKIGMVVNNSEQSDLALIKLLETPRDIRPLSLANPSTIKVGQDVHAIGHPGNGAVWTYTRGYIGQIINDHEWNYGDGIDRSVKMLIQSQTPIMEGNSGGPLLNDDGEVIGVNSFGSDYAGANYAISVKDLEIFLNEKYTIPKAPPKTARAKKASNEYELNIIKITKADWDEDGKKDTLYFLDEDNTGIWETVLVEISGREELIVIDDFDENGTWDRRIIDSNNNSYLDLHIFDQNGDGKADLIGYDDDEDGEVDRYEEV